MSSLVGSEESHPSMWHHVPVPPRLGSEEMIDIVASNNNTLTIDINKGVKNQNCKVRLFRVGTD